VLWRNREKIRKIGPLTQAITQSGIKLRFDLIFLNSSFKALKKPFLEFKTITPFITMQANGALIWVCVHAIGAGYH